MDLLDNSAHRQRIDSKNVYRALAHLPEQAESAWQNAQKLTRPARRFRSVVVAGMGGSALGAHVVETACADKLRVPMRIVSGYALPGDVGRDDLVILSSYSGSTEEVLACLADAVKRKAQIAGLCAGGALAKQLSAKKAPLLQFDARFNPGSVPRYGVGSATFGVAGMLARFGALALSRTEVASVIVGMRSLATHLKADVAAVKNPAKRLAKEIEKRFVLWMGGDHLVGALHVVANMTHESGKHMAAYYPLPELNHHLLEGFKHPAPIVRNTTALLFSSNLYHPRLQKRVPITAQVLKKNHVLTHTIPLRSPTRLGQALEAVMLGSYTGYYLALLERTDPSPNPWVDYFKKALGSP